MNVRLFLAGVLTLFAGMASEYHNAWVVTAFGLAMITASILPALIAPPEAARRPITPAQAQTPIAERIVRERWRERRERYWPFDDAA